MNERKNESKFFIFYPKIKRNKNESKGLRFYFIDIKRNKMNGRSKR
jgi:hypothetical protein